MGTAYESLLRQQTFHFVRFEGPTTQATNGKRNRRRPLAALSLNTAWPVKT